MHYRGPGTLDFAYEYKYTSAAGAAGRTDWGPGFNAGQNRIHPSAADAAEPGAARRISQSIASNDMSVVERRTR